MRILHKGLILVLVPLVLSVLITCATFVFLVQTDILRIADLRQRQVCDYASSTMLSLTEAMDELETGVDNANIKPAKIKVRKAVEQVRAFENMGRTAAPGTYDLFYSKVDKLFLKIGNGCRDLSVALRRGGSMAIGALAAFSNVQRSLAEDLVELTDMSHATTMEYINYSVASAAREQEMLRIQIAIILGGIAASIVAAFMLARWFMRDISHRLQLITDNTLRLSRDQPLNPIVPGVDEIAALDRGFHNMANVLRQAMAKERALFDNASDVICILDENDRITAANPACTRLLGYSRDLLLSMSLESLIEKDDVEKTKKALRQIRDNDPSTTFETVCTTAGGKPLELLWSAYWSDIDGATYVVAHDITEHKQSERAKEEFLAMVSHDLRSPLSSIFGTFKLIAAGAFGPLPQLAGEKIELMVSNVNRLLGLVNDILDVDKLQAGKLELAPEKTKIDDLIQRAVQEINPIAAQKQVRINVDCSPLDFSLDADRILQVLLNLLSNAVKYSPEGSEIAVVAENTAEGLRVSISDRGRGVAAAQQEAIFERYKQAQLSDSRTGSGLGLPICKLIVEQHGGTIAVSSKEGAGSTFWFQLPDRLISSVQTPPAIANDRKKFAAQAASRRNLAQFRAPTKRRFSFTNLPLVYKGAILVLVPVVFEICFCGSLLKLLLESDHAKQREHQQTLVGMRATDLMMVHSTWLFSSSIRDWKARYNAFQKFSKEGFDDLRALQEIARDDAVLKPVVTDLQTFYEPLVKWRHHTDDVLEQVGLSEDGVRLALAPDFSVREFLPQMIARARHLVAVAAEHAGKAPERLQQLRVEQGTLLIGGLLASVLICALSAVLFANGIARRLKVTEEHVRRLEKDQAPGELLSGEDEVAHLDQYLHNMYAALNEARHKERAVFDNAQDIICAIDREGNILRSNPACASVLGYSKADIEGSSLYAIVDRDQSSALAAALTEAAKDSGAIDFECRVQALDGSIREILWSLSWSAPESAVIAIGHDITRRKELERLKQEFLSIVSHDMRTPLAAISMTTEMLAAGTLGEMPEKAKQQLGVVCRSCDRLLSLINDLLDVDKLESGQMQLNIQPVAAEELLQRSAEALQTMAQTRGISIVVDVQPGLAVNADADRVVQVGVNLLSNAIKFSPDQSTIRLTARGGDGYVEFAVIDAGRGIPASKINSVFERFTQVEVADGKRTAGTGLGLPICKQIITQHGGSIGVSSEVNKGSEFWFRLPSAAPVKVHDNLKTF